MKHRKNITYLATTNHLYLRLFNLISRQSALGIDTKNNKLTSNAHQLSEPHVVTGITTCT